MTASLLHRWAIATEAELLGVLDAAPSEVADRVLFAREGQPIGFAVGARSIGGGALLHRSADLASALACDGLAAVLRRPSPETPLWRPGLLVAAVAASGCAAGLAGTHVEWVTLSRADDGTIAPSLEPMPETWRERNEQLAVPALRKAIARAGRQPDWRLATVRARAMRRGITLVLHELEDFQAA